MLYAENTGIILYIILYNSRLVCRDIRIIIKGVEPKTGVNSSHKNTHTLTYTHTRRTALYGEV